MQSRGKALRLPPSYVFATQLPSVILNEVKNQVGCYSVCRYRSRLSTGIRALKLILHFVQNDSHNPRSPNPNFAPVLGAEIVCIRPDLRHLLVDPALLGFFSRPEYVEADFIAAPMVGA
jgi:hypothetical protein